MTKTPSTTISIEFAILLSLVSAESGAIRGAPSKPSSRVLQTNNELSGTLPAELFLPPPRYTLENAGAKGHFLTVTDTRFFSDLFGVGLEFQDDENNSTETESLEFEFIDVPCPENPFYPESFIDCQYVRHVSTGRYLGSSGGTLPIPIASPSGITVERTRDLFVWELVETNCGRESPCTRFHNFGQEIRFDPFSQPEASLSNVLGISSMFEGAALGEDQSSDDQLWITTRV